MRIPTKDLLNPYRPRMKRRNDKAQKKRFVESLLKVSFTFVFCFPFYIKKEAVVSDFYCALVFKPAVGGNGLERSNVTQPQMCLSPLSKRFANFFANFIIFFFIIIVFCQTVLDCSLGFTSRPTGSYSVYLSFFQAQN